MCNWDHVHDACCLGLPYDERLQAVASAGKSNDVVGATELRKGMILCIGLQCQTWWASAHCLASILGMVHLTSCSLIDTIAPALAKPVMLANL